MIDVLKIYAMTQVMEPGNPLGALASSMMKLVAVSRSPLEGVSFVPPGRGRAAEVDQSSLDGVAD